MSPTALASDPVAWLARAPFEAVPLAAGLGALPLVLLALLFAAGALLLLFGARRREPVAALGGAALGWLGGYAAAGALELGGKVAGPLGAAILGGGALAFPPLFPLAAGAVPGALAGSRFPVAGHPALGAAIGLLLLGGLALLGARLVAAAAAGLLGAAACGAALAGLSRHLPELRPLVDRPALLLALVVVLAVAGAAYQSPAAWPAPGARGRAEADAETRVMPTEAGP
ncbi:MAG TPA: hypothetical protein VH880_01000 [Anaeromyxobacteraceae bacterium]|jgi:hypothetical protein